MKKIIITLAVVLFVYAAVSSVSNAPQQTRASGAVTLISNIEPQNWAFMHLINASTVFSTSTTDVLPKNTIPSVFAGWEYTGGALTATTTATSLSFSNLTLTNGTWQGTAIADTYIASAATWNAKQAAGNYITALTGDVAASGPGSAAATIANNAVTYAKFQNLNYGEIIGRNTAGAGVATGIATSTYKTMLALVKGDVGLGSVENTALSTWAGTSNITTLGTITTGTWNGTKIAVANGGTGWSAIQAGTLMYGNGSGAIATTSAATAGNILAFLNNIPTWVATTTLNIGGSAGSVANALSVDNTTLQLNSGTSYNGSAARTINLNLGNANTWTATQTFSNATYSALFTGGNVGIGTTTPVSLLSVNGQMTFGSTATSSLSNLGSIVWNGTSFYGKTGMATTSSTGWFNLAQDNTIDVFLIAGQSNAQGAVDDPTLSPKVPTGKVLQYYQGVISDANDPVGNASRGSAWPSFGLTYYNATGHRVAFVPAAVSGSGMAAVSNPSSNWDTTGSLYSTSVTNANAAIGALTAAGFTPVFKGVLWDQGEQDAQIIQAGSETIAQYKSAFATMIGNYRTQFGLAMPFYIFKTGTIRTFNDTYLAQVRQAQDDVANGDLYTKVVFRNAIDYLERGLMSTTTLAHFTQSGYNEMGAIAASNIVSGIANDSFQHASSTAGSNLYYTAGSVGIGTANPTALLSIMAAATTSAAFTPNLFSIASTTGNFATSTFLVVNNLGNVGIGTANPTEKLAIARLTVAGTGGQIIVASTTDSTTGSLAGFVAYTGGQNLNIYAHDSARTAQRYGFSLGGWDEISQFANQGGTPNGIVMGTQTAAPLVFGTNNLERMRIDGSTGNVGIGTASPQRKLDIRTTSGNGLIIGDGPIGTAGSNWGYFELDTSGSVPFLDITTQRDSQAYGNIVLNRAGGNVGIGTATPGTKLDVYGNGANVTSRVYAGVDGNQSATLALGPLTTRGWNLTSNAYNSTKNKYDLTITQNGYAGDLILMDGTQTGNVGIGTTGPGYKLDVNGDVNVAAGSAYRYNGVPVITASTTLSNYFFGNTGNLTMTGGNNFALGYGGLNNNTTGTTNTAVGQQTLLYNTTGSNNTSVGYYALVSNTTGGINTAIGVNALYSNTTGTQNVATGFNSLRSNVTGNNNTAYGTQALQNTTASNNTAVGLLSGYGITTGANNVLIGASDIAASYNQITTGSNNIAIGYDVAVASPTASNQLNIGNLIYGTGLNGTGSTVSTGNVGIGTTGPLSKLQIQGAFLAGQNNATDAPNAFGQAPTVGLSIIDSGAEGQYRGGSLGFGGQTTSVSPYLWAVIKGGKENATPANYSGYLGFWTIGSAGTSNEWMRITSTGNVGIGTTIPQRQFETYTAGGAGAGHSYLRIGSGANGGYGGDATLEGTYNDYGNVGDATKSNVLGKIVMSSRVNIPTDVGGIMSFYTKADGGTYATAPLVRMTIDQSGNVGIGTTTPAASLDVYKNTDGAANMLSITNVSTGAGAQAMMYLSNGYANNMISAVGVNALAAVGGGVYSHYTNKLAVIAGTNSNGLDLIASSGTAASSTINFFTGGETNDKQRMIITAAGNVGIGTINPYGALTVAGANGGASTVAGVSLGNTTSSYADMELYNSGGGAIDFSGTSGRDFDFREIFTAATNDLQFYSSSTQPILTLKGTGNVGIGTASPGAYRLKVTGSTIAGNGGVAIIGGNDATDYALIVNNAANTLNYLTVRGDGQVAIPTGNVGIGTTTPWRTLSVTGTVGFDGLTAGTGTTLCLSATKEVVTCSGGGTVTSITAATPNSTLTLGGINPITTSGTINFDLNLAHANTWTALQQFNGNASTTALTVSGTTWLTGITGSTQCLQVDANGKIQGTGTSCGSGSGGITALTGDVAASGSGSVVATIANNAVTYAKFQNLNYGEIIGRNTAGAGVATGIATSTYKTMLALVKGDVGLGSVENTALSTWAGTSNITTLGTITTGTWNGTKIAVANGGTGWSAIQAGTLMYGNGSGAIATTTAATAGNILAYLNNIPTWVSTTTLNIGGTAAGLTSAGFANPTGTIGLTAVNGSATTAMRSDAAPALSQAIAPTWTGTHTFSNATYSALFTGGNVGIGTANPSTGKLQIDGFNYNENLITLQASNQSSRTYGMGTYSTGTGVGFAIRDNTAATERLAITETGNVGIGTTTPQATLTVYRSDSNQPALAVIGANGHGTTQGAGVYGYSSFLPATGERLGYFGMGYTAGTPALTYNSAATAAFATENWTAGSAQGTALAFQVTANGTASRSEVMRIDQNGNVGIGTAAPSYPLDVNGIINTSQYGGYKQDGVSVLYASTTNKSVAIGTEYVGMNAATWMRATSTPFYDLAIGQGALAATPANAGAVGNTGIGVIALNSNTIGTNNLGVGYSSLAVNTSGSYNTGVGSFTMYQNISSSNNTAVGHNAGNTLTGGSGYNTFLGSGSGAAVAVAATLTNATAVGANISLTASNTVVLGNNANVGIGVTGPGTKLDIRDTTQALGTSNVTIRTTDAYSVADAGGKIGLGGVVNSSGSSLNYVELKAGKTYPYDGDVSGYFSIATRNNTALTERMRIDMNGNVGIGTTTPAYKLHVAGSSGAVSTAAALELEDTSGNAASRNWVIGNSFGANYGDLSFVAGAALGSTPTGGASGSGAAQIKMTIQSGGNVGIGTASPNGKLVVVGTSQAGSSGDTGVNSFRFTTGTGATTDESLAFGIHDGDYSWIQADKPGASARNLALQPAGGNVGIGATVPASKLDVSGTIRSTAYVAPTSGAGLEMAYTGTYGQIYTYDRTGSAYIDTVLGSGGNQLYLKANGAVGLGTAGPLSKLDVNGGVAVGSYAGASVAPTNGMIISGRLGVGITSPSYGFVVSNAGAAGLEIDPAGGILSGGIGIQSYNRSGAAYVPMMFDASGSGKQLYLATTGNVGIGTTTPGMRFDIVGTANSGFRLSDSSNYTEAVSLSTQSGADAMYTGGEAGRAVLRSTGRNFIIGTTDTSYLAFGTNLTEKMRILSGGNVGIGTTTPTKALSVQTAGTGNAGLLQYSDTYGGYLGTMGGSVTGNLYLVPSSKLVSIGDGGVGAYNLYMYNGSTLANAFSTNGNSYFNGGNVGVGITGPAYKLQVYTAGANSVGFTSDNNANLVNQVTAGTGGYNIYRFIQSAGTITAPTALGGGYDLGTIQFQGRGTTANQTTAQIRVRNTATISDTSAPSNMYFEVTPAGAVAPATQLTILSTGNVGIGSGATNPGSKLYVAGDFAVSSTLNTPLIWGNTTGTGALIALSQNGTQKFAVDGSGNFVAAGIAQFSGTGSSFFTGNVGIGATVPRVPLNVQVATQNDSMTLGTPSGGFMVGNGNNLYGLLAGVANDGHAWMQVGRVDGTATAYNLSLQASGGNVGIGLTDPGTYKLNVNGSVFANGAVKVRAATTGIDSDGTSLYLNSGGNTYLNTASNAYVTSAGGASFAGSLTIPLQTNQYIGASVNDGLYFDGSGNYNTTLNSSTGVGLVFENDGGTAKSFFIGTGNTDPDSATKLLTVLQNGNVGIGTGATTPGYKLTVDGDVVAKGPKADVRAFGAKCDGTTDDSAAFQSAINTLAAANGGTIIVPAGICYLGSATLAIQTDGITIEGQGPAGSDAVGTTLKFGAGTGDAIRFGYATGSNRITGGGLRNLAINEYLRTGESAAIAVRLASFMLFENIVLGNGSTSAFNNGIRIFGSNNVQITGVNGYAKASSSGTIGARDALGNLIDGGVPYGIYWSGTRDDGTGYPSDILSLKDVTINMQLAGGDGIIWDGRANTFTMQSVRMLHVHTGMLVVNNSGLNDTRDGNYPMFLEANGFEVDQATAFGVKIDAGKSFNFTDSYIYPGYDPAHGVTTDVALLLNAGTGYSAVTDVTVTGGQVGNATNSCIRSYASYVKLTNVKVDLCSMGNTVPAIQLMGTAQHTSIIGGTAGPVTLSTAANHSNYGLELANGVDYVQVYGTDIAGTVGEVNDGSAAAAHISIMTPTHSTIGVGSSSGSSLLTVAGGIVAKGGAFTSQAAGYTFAGGNGDTDSGMYSTADGTLQFATNAAQRIRLNSSGDVGIGGYLPNNTDMTGSILTVLGSGYVGVGTTTPTWSMQINKASGYADDTVGAFAISNPTTPTKKMYMGYDTSLGTNGSGFIQAVQTAAAWTPLLLNPNGGKVGIGLSSPTSVLDIKMTTGTSFQRWITASDNTPELTLDYSSSPHYIAFNTNTINWPLILQSGSNAAYQVGIATTTVPSGYVLNVGNASVQGYVAQFGNKNGMCAISPTNGSLQCTSDARLKKNFVSIDSATALEGIRALNPTYFNWRAEEDGTVEHSGFIAQQVLPIFPDLVSTTTNDTYLLNYAGFTPYLVASTQVLDTRTGGMAVDTAQPMSFVLGTTTVTTHIPSAVLTASGGVDLYKLATYDLAGITALADKLAALNVRMDSLEDRVAKLENGSIAMATSSSPFSTTTLISAFNSLGAYIAQGVAQFGTLVADRFVAAADSAGNSSAGNGTILQGNMVAEVTNAYVQPTSKIFVTFTSPVSGSWYLSNKQDGSFRVSLQNPQGTDISFDYFIVETTGQIATSTPAAAVNSNPHWFALTPSAPLGDTSTAAATTPVVTASTTPATGSVQTTISSDTVPPSISLVGEAAIQLAEGATFTDPGATASDAVDGDITSKITVTGSVNAAVAGLYTLTYNVTDGGSNEAHVSRVVTIVPPPSSPVVTDTASSTTSSTQQ